LPVGRCRLHWPGGRGANWPLTGAQTYPKWPGMNIELDRSRPVPLARQIEEQIERLIQERLLGPGVKLPATRELAGQLGVNRATVALAYEELVAAGLVRAHVGQGTFVTGRSEGPAPPIRGAAAIDWSGLFSRNAQIIGADEERRRGAGVPATLE